MSIYLEHNGEQFGPFTAAQAKQYIAEGRFDAADLGWIDGMADWLPIADIPELRAALAAPEPSILPPMAPSLHTTSTPLPYSLPNAPYPPPTYPGYAPEKTTAAEFASFSRRAAAFGIDVAIASSLMAFASLIFVFLFGLGVTGLGSQRLDETTNMLLALGFLILLVGIWIVYFAFFHATASMGGPGKIIFGLSVVDMQGKRLGFIQSLWRECVRALASIILFLTYFTQPFTAHRQTVHDLLARTLVLRKSADAGLPAAAVWVVNIVIAAVLAIVLLTLIGISV